MLTSSSIQSSPAIAVSTRRVFPLSRGPSNPKVKPLSIIDASVLRYAPTSATWFFDISPGFSLDALVFSLQKTLDAYPQWSGSLHTTQAPHDTTSNIPHNQRFARPRLAWGFPTDPGVELVIAESIHKLSPLLPTPAERTSTKRIWDGSVIASLGLLPDSPKLALHDRLSHQDLPCMVVQITIFACGGIAIAVKLAHPLADAQTLLSFVHDWAAIHRGAEVPERPFEPETLDEAAQGDINMLEPDEAILARAQKIPLHRYDWWASATPDCPPFMLQETEVPSAIRSHPAANKLGKPLPWAEWDILKPVAYRLVYFSRSEILAIWKAAVAESPSAEEAPPKISKLDALLAHIWSLIVRAREISSKDFNVHLDVTIGLRSRLGLPANFLGSPILNVPVTVPASQVKLSSAARIRSAIAPYDHSALGDMLHELAYEVDLSRRWNAFLGQKHTIVTSWLENRPGMSAYDVDFGFDAKPRIVDPLMPECDGCVQIMESGSKSRNGSDTNQWVPWYEDGVSVSLHFREDVLSKILADDKLFP